MTRKSRPKKGVTQADLKQVDIDAEFKSSSSSDSSESESEDDQSERIVPLRAVFESSVQALSRPLRC